MERGDLSTPLDCKGPDEFSSVYAAFEHMRRHLLEEQKKNARYEQARTDLVAGISHDLRTPLTSVKGYIKGMRDGVANTPEKREQYLDIILEESDRMAHLVGSLLELSRLEAGAELHRETFNLAALVREVWEPLSLSLEQKHLTLSLELADYIVEGDRERLRELADNLASNALRHAVPGGRIRVTLKAEEAGVRLTVQNDGLPIPPDAP